jgi:hypothetical protein
VARTTASTSVARHTLTSCRCNAQVPLALAENSGLAPIESLTAVRKRQMEEKNPYLGIDCNEVGTNDMREQNVFETYLSKRQQLFLATQVGGSWCSAGCSSDAALMDGALMLL